MLVTVIALKYALLGSQLSYGHFHKLTDSRKESKGDEAERGERGEKMGGFDLDICPGLQRPSVPSHATV